MHMGGYGNTETTEGGTDDQIGKEEYKDPKTTQLASRLLTKPKKGAAQQQELRGGKHRKKRPTTRGRSAKAKKGREPAQKPHKLQRAWKRQ